jgi:exopolysaccharide biosynthesis predicted pyruvyltransferase EpsI
MNDLTLQTIAYPDGYATALAESRNKLLNAIGDSDDITFVRIHGNIGDHLIYAGARQLLSGVQYKERSVLHLQGVRGHTAILSGGGGWCGTYHDVPFYLPQVEKRFERVIVFPTSFDTSIGIVKKILSGSKAIIFARERESYRQIRDLCNSDIAHDSAFFFDYRPFIRPGLGVLNAYREDREAVGYKVPKDNNDISLTCESLDEWLWEIARHAVIRTDRAHVTLAAALLGKRVEYRSSNYHKVPGIVEFGLKGFPVFRMDNPSDVASALERMKESSNRDASEDASRTALGEARWTRRTIVEIMDQISPDKSFILVDNDAVRPALGRESTAMPFLEKDGQYWGAPPDDETAIKEFERLRNAGASRIIFAWTAFWWLDYYTGFHEHLRSNYRCVLQNEQLVVFDLSTSQADGNAENSSAHRSELTV